MSKEDAIRTLVETLRPFQRTLTEDENEPEREAEIRDIVRKALRELQVYDAHGCPLCLG